MEYAVSAVFELIGASVNMATDKIKSASGFDRLSLKKRKLLKDALFFAIITCIPLIQFCIFYIGVNANSIIMSFQDYDRTTATFSWAGLSNYARFFKDLGSNSMWRSAFLNSTLALIVELFVTKTLAIIFSYYIYKRRKGYKIFRVILFIPSIISSLITVAVFSQFVDGAVPQLLTDLVGKPVQGLLANDKSQFSTILFYNVWVAFGPSLLMYSNAMNEIPMSVGEAAAIDGAGPFREFVSIVFPMIWPTYVVFFVASLAIYFSNSLNLYAFYGSWAEERVYTFGYFLFQTAEVNKATMTDYPYLSAIGICFTTVLAPIVLGIRKLMLKCGPRTE